MASVSSVSISQCRVGRVACSNRRAAPAVRIAVVVRGMDEGSTGRISSVDLSGLGGPKRTAPAAKPAEVVADVPLQSEVRKHFINYFYFAR